MPAHTVGPRRRRRSIVQRLNRKLALEALRHGISRAQQRPLNVTLQVSSACNLDCYMCSEHNRPVDQRHGRGLVSLPRELFDRVAEEVLPYSSRLTIGMGGEPTLSQDFVYFLTRAFELGQEVHLVTNGTRLYREDVARAVSSHVSYLNLSIDAASKATYERIRRGARWGALRANVDALNRFRLRHAPAERTHLTLCIVLMRSNVHELGAFVELAAEVEAEAVHAQHVIPLTEEGRSELLIHEPELYDRHRAIAVERAEELGVALDLPGPYRAAARPSVATATAPAGPPHAEPAPPARAPTVVAARGAHGPADVRPVESRRDGAAAPRAAPPAADPLRIHRIPCAMPTLDVFVTYDGRVMPCCHPFAHRKMTMGDLNRQSFEEIWNGPLYRHLRAGLWDGGAPHVCRTCSVVHDPPPAAEDPDALEESPAIADYFAGRDPRPAGAPVTGLRDELRVRAMMGGLRFLRLARVAHRSPRRPRPHRADVR